MGVRWEYHASGTPITYTPGFRFVAGTLWGILRFHLPAGKLRLKRYYYMWDRGTVAANARKPASAAPPSRTRPGTPGCFCG